MNLSTLELFGGICVFCFLFTKSLSFAPNMFSGASLFYYFEDKHILENFLWPGPRSSSFVVSFEVLLVVCRKKKKTSDMLISYARDKETFMPSSTCFIWEIQSERHFKVLKKTTCHQPEYQWQQKSLAVALLGTSIVGNFIK